MNEGIWWLQETNNKKISRYGELCGYFYGRRFFGLDTIMSDRDSDHMLLELQEARAEIDRLQARVSQMDEILESCWRYFDHCLRVSLPRQSCDRGELMVRMTLMRDAMRSLGLIDPLPGEGGV